MSAALGFLTPDSAAIRGAVEVLTWHETGLFRPHPMEPIHSRKLAWAGVPQKDAWTFALAAR
jgi:hypothetical protein